jgi:hypothetical protein
MYLLENVPSKSVCPISRSDRKNLAVHVSLSSIFTMSKSGPWEPLSRAASVEAVLPNFWEQNFASGHPAAYLPYQKFAAAGPQGRLHQRGGLYGRPFLVSTPENDKTDKKRNRYSASSETPGALGFFAPSTGDAQIGFGDKNCKSGDKHPTCRTPVIAMCPLAAGRSRPASRKCAAIGADQPVDALRLDGAPMAAHEFGLSGFRRSRWRAWPQ